MRSETFFAVLITFFCFVGAAVADDKELRIGAIFSLSGWGADGGTAEMNGVKLAVEQLNATGGAGGRVIKLLIEDNRSDLRATADAFQKLVSVDKVPVVLGPNWSEFTEVIAPLAKQSQVPTVTASGYIERYLGPDPWLFILWPPPTAATEPLARYMQAKGYKRVVALVSENTYYQNVFRALKGQLEATGVKFVEVNEYPPDHMDYRTLIARMVQQKPDAIVSFLREGGELASFLKQKQDLKLDVPCYGANTIPFDVQLQTNLPLAEGLVYFDYDLPGGEQFASRYKARFDKEPGFGSAKAYDSVGIVTKAVEKCGDSAAQIRKCLRELSHAGVSGNIHFSAKGLLEEFTPKTHLLTVKNGVIEKLPVQ